MLPKFSNWKEQILLSRGWNTRFFGYWIIKLEKGEQEKGKGVGRPWQSIVICQSCPRDMCFFSSGSIIGHVTTPGWGVILTSEPIWESSNLHFLSYSMMKKLQRLKRRRPPSIQLEQCVIKTWSLNSVVGENLPSQSLRRFTIPTRHFRIHPVGSQRHNNLGKCCRYLRLPKGPSSFTRHCLSKH